MLQVVPRTSHYAQAGPEVLEGDDDAVNGYVVEDEERGDGDDAEHVQQRVPLRLEPSLRTVYLALIYSRHRSFAHFVVPYEQGLDCPTCTELSTSDLAPKILTGGIGAVKEKSSAHSHVPSWLIAARPVP